MQTQLQTLGAILGVIVAGITILKFGATIMKWVANQFINFIHFITRYKPKIPRETVRIVPNLHQCWWHMGSENNEKAMQVSGKFDVTNITDKPIKLLRAFLVNPGTEGHALVKHHQQQSYGDYELMSFRSTPGSFDFWIKPPILKIGQDLKSNIIVVDQYDNRHKIKGFVFRGPKPKKAEKKLPVESIYSITNPIEKDVVGVLKAEIHRYKECGRSCGGLGSIQTIFQDRSSHGVGFEWRETNSPKNQSIVEDVRQVQISSDNAQALGNLFHKSELTQQNEIIRALITRLSRDMEYVSVGYFILFVLFSFGHLVEALNVAKINLYGHSNGDIDHGFSNFLWMLDGLLRFSHPSFTNKNLDQVEVFLDGIEEHVFRIPERIAAIRSFRLRIDSLNPVSPGTTPLRADL